MLKISRHNPNSFLISKCTFGCCCANRSLSFNNIGHRKVLFLLPKKGNGMSETTGQAIAEASSVVTSVSAKTAVGGSIAGLSGKFLGLDPVTALGLVIAISGLLVSFMSFLINWYYKRQENKRADELHQLALQKAKGECYVKE